MRLILTTHKFGAKFSDEREISNLCFIKHKSIYIEQM